MKVKIILTIVFIIAIIDIIFVHKISFRFKSTSFTLLINKYIDIMN